MREAKHRAIIDIGSNTVRLVLFAGAPRAPVVLYNEKVIAGLGRGVVQSGRLDELAMGIALAALSRFKLLLDSMDVGLLRVVATAAVRDAANGAAFLDKVRALGLPAELLGGDEESVASGHGVISSIPDADGIVADLGGGSLELVRVGYGRVMDRISLPLGILAIPPIREKAPRSLRRHVQQLVAGIPWAWQCNTLPLYLVGGSWRSLARVHIHLTGFPLPILGNHSISASEARPLADRIATMDRHALKAIPGMPSGRVAMIPDASALLAALVEAISPSDLIVSAFGLREGLLYQALPAEERERDPLIEGVRFATQGRLQFSGHADALLRWLDGLFGDEPPRLRRLRHAACLMFDTGWSSNPDFRAQGGEELALTGSWIGITSAERAIMGMALFVGMGGSGQPPAILPLLAEPNDLERARSWGLALRLAQRLSGGTTGIIGAIPIFRERDRIVLKLPEHLAKLVDDTAKRRFERLAEALNCTTEISGAPADARIA